MKVSIQNVLFIALFFMTFSSLIFGQINESDTFKFQLRTSLTGMYQKGNVEITAVRSRLDFSLIPVKNVVFKSQNSSLYQAFYSKKADNDIFSRNFFYFKPKNKVYPFAIGYVSANFRRKIDLRYFAGLGATYQIVNMPRHVIKLSASAVYEKTNFAESTYNYPEYNGFDNIHLWRGTIYVGGWNYLFERRLRLFYDAYWQPAFASPDNYRTQIDIGLDFPIWKGLSFNMLYSIAHENVVIKNIIQDDKLLTFGLAYLFKKSLR